MTEFIISIPMRLGRGGNDRGMGWKKKYGQNLKQAKAVAQFWKSGTRWQKINLPVEVTLTRISGGRGPLLDDDNLVGSFKAIRDQVAKQLGVDDADKRVKWCYEQRKGKWGFEIKLRINEENNE